MRYFKLHFSANITCLVIVSALPTWRLELQWIELQAGKVIDMGGKRDICESVVLYWKITVLPSIIGATNQVYY